MINKEKKRILVYQLMSMKSPYVEIACRPLLGDIELGDNLKEATGRDSVLRVISIEVGQKKRQVLFNNYSGILFCEIVSGEEPIIPSEYFEYESG